MVYGLEAWSLSANERRKIAVVKVMCLRNMCGIRRVDGVRNAIVRERCGCKLNVLERIERNVLKGFGHVERMEEERLVKRVYQANVEDSRGRERVQREDVRKLLSLLYVDDHVPCGEMQEICDSNGRSLSIYAKNKEVSRRVKITVR